MKTYIAGLALLFAAAGMPLTEAYPHEPRGFGDMAWGDSVRTVSERYASRYLEETRSGGALYAVNFSDFRDVLGIRGPLVVTAAFDPRGKLVQINVPLSTDNGEEAETAFRKYTENLETLCGAPARAEAETAFWQGGKTNILVQKRKEGILVSFVDARWMKQKAK